MEETKKKLREQSMKILMERGIDSVNDSFIKLFNALIKFPETLDICLNSFTKQNQIPFVLKIFQLLQEPISHFSFSEDEKKKLADLFCEIIAAQLPQSTSKLDMPIVNFLQTTAQISKVFSSHLSQIQNQNISQNSYVQSYLLFVYCYSRDPLLKDKIFPFLNQKLTFNAMSLASLFVLANETEASIKKISEPPTLKGILSLYKTAYDNGMSDFITPLCLRYCTKFVNESNAKEAASLLQQFLKKLKKDTNNMSEFSNFRTFLMDFNEAVPQIKQSIDDILSAFIQTVNDSADIGPEISDPMSYVSTDIAQCFVKICVKFEINQCQTLQQKCASFPRGVILLSIFVCKNMSTKEFESIDRENMIADLLEVCPQDSTNFQLLIALCGYFVVEFNSRRGLEVLVQGLSLGSRIACNWLASEQMDFDTVFTELASEFDPDKSGQLYLRTLISILQANVQQQPDELLPADDSLTAYSDSNFESISGMSRYSSDNCDSDLQGVPTPATTLFCTTISKYLDHPELCGLLPLAAAAVSPQFATDLTKNMKSQKRKKSKMELVISYSNSLQSLDIQTLHSLAQTFLLLSPGVPMLFLAVSLQRLPRDTIRKMMQKTTPFASTSPDFFARMIALVSHSHADIALSFLDSFIDSTLQKRRVFFFLRSTEDNELISTAVFQSIGYSATIVDPNFFASDFLPFATRFLNKHLTHKSKTNELFAAQLFAIRKLSTRLVKYQEQHSDHVFPFKDFLVQFVCAYYMDVSENIINNNSHDISMVQPALQALTALLPVHPVRITDKHERSVDLTSFILQNVNDDDFQVVFNAATMFYTELIKTNPTVFVITGIITPIITSILYSKHWIDLAKLLSQISSMWESVKIAQGSAYLSQLISQFGPLFTDVLPLLSSEIGETALNIVENISSLQCAIRNQILSLPRSIRPSIPALSENATVEEVTKIGCTFLSKNLLTSQVFEIITGLLELANSPKILKTHIKGCVLCAYYLIEERGSEEFRYDSQIISLLVKASNNSEEVLQVALRIFKILGGMRFFSVISSLTMLKVDVQPILPKIIEKLMENENASGSLLTEVSNMTVDESNDLSWFTAAALPLLNSAIAESSDDDFARLFVGVCKQTNDLANPLFFSLFGGENMNELLTNIEQERPLVFPLIISLLPEDYNPFFSVLALHIAEVSEESCNAVLAYFFNDLKQIDDDSFDILNNVLSKHPFDAWQSQYQQIAILVADNIQTDEHALKCAKTYIEKCDEDSLNFIWTSIVSHIVSDYDNWLNIIGDLSSRIDVLAFGPIIPQLVVRAKKPTAALILGKIGEINAVDGDGNKDKKDLIQRILSCDLFSNCDFISEFVSMIKKKEFVTESIAAIAMMCDQITEKNAYAVETIIEEAASINCDEDNCAISVLQELLF